MKKLRLASIAAVRVSVIPATAVQWLAAADNPPPARKIQSGTTFQNADITRVAKAWERKFGGTVTGSERARGQRVSMEISAPSQDELRKQFVAALRENGIVVIERTDGVLFDAVPATKSSG